MIDNQQLDLILASNSAGRKALLTGANIKFRAIASDLDEDIIKHDNQKRGLSPRQTAQDLADAKAFLISKQNRSALILGSDQICHLEGEILNKPGKLENLFGHIKRLSGHTHILTSAISIAYNDQIIYRHSDDAKLTMYDLSDVEIADYVAHASDQVVNAAGGYHLEHIGVQLFKQIEGSYFTILGLPLLPLIGFLNQYQKNQTDKQ